METLVHSKEKNTASAVSRVVGEKAPVGWMAWIRRTWTKTVASARWDRLEGSLRVAQVEIEQRLDARLRTQAHAAAVKGGESDGLHPELWWTGAAQSLLCEAQSALNQGQLDQGWKLLHAARRLEIPALDSERELPAVAATLRAESEKLKSWRQKAVQTLLGTSEKPIEPKPSTVYQAALIRDEHYDNQGYKDGLLRTQILFLALILAAVMGSLLGVVHRWGLRPDQEAGQTTLPVFTTLVLFGLLGGTVSAMLRTTDAAQPARIPETTAAIRVTFMRIMMGGASAVVIYVFLNSKLTGIFNQDIANALSTLEPYTTYALAFVAGFSERLVLRAVEQVAGAEQAAGQTKAKAESS